MVKMGTVWDRTAEFLSDNIAAILPIALLAFFVPASIEGNFEAATTGAGPGFKALLSALQILFALVSLWGSLAITAMALDIASERSAANIATRRFLPALAVTLVIFVGAALLVLPIPGILAFSGYDMAAIANRDPVAISSQMGWFIGLYLIALTLLLLWLAARLILATPVVIRENRILSAIGQSWSLTRGAALRIVGVILLYAIVSIVAGLAARTVFGSIFALVAGNDGEGVTLSTVMTSIVVGAVQSAFMVIPPAFTARLYLALTAQAGRHGEAAA
ncbi:glycerophosphoryl diester phosphodiesterase membrane domain-containing protein [Sphingomonas sp. DG1-23]|uniref:glycerophosphoryl diester phosphodiesterase membrane domain-containing protein n=1 Tax=Sphingomonas sp. DG1-23 TaxID=3068316 RepID=UPI00273DA126|nr:glycerophosphoryl diester phosphodiesterase membrane domain-containing protein [Sphingomonas sp. DG1-23]MDP5278841.1 glycerophosphoryl diester phosphodiesterase membrane domain-containing protein [Sphingomonas sp. DG1-23]